MADPRRLSSNTAFRTIDGKQVQVQTEKYEDGRIVVSRWNPDAKDWEVVDESTDDELAKTWDRRQAQAANQTKDEDAAPKTAKLSDGTDVQWDPGSKSWKPIDVPRGDAKPTPMSEYQRAEVERGKAADARAEAAARRTENQQTVQNNRADRAERARTRLAELQAQVQQGNLTEAQARNQWDRFKFENYDLPRQQRADALAERNANRADTREERASRVQEYGLGQTAARDAVDRARLAHDDRRTAAYFQAKAGGKSPQQAIATSTGLEAPDFDAIAEAAAARAIAQLQGLGAPPPPQGAPVGAGAGAPPPSPLAARAPAPLGAGGAVAQPGGTGMVGRFGQ